MTDTAKVCLQAMIFKDQWKDADPEALEPWYSYWVSELTTQGLHSKADIATVLAILSDRLAKAARPEERRMTPKQLDALRMLNNAFESHDGRPVEQAIITEADYRLLYEALAEGTAGDRIAKELLSIPSPPRRTDEDERK